jgi:antitoxin FitA
VTRAVVLKVRHAGFVTAARGGGVRGLAVLVTQVVPTRSVRCFPGRAGHRVDPPDGLGAELPRFRRGGAHSGMGFAGGGGRDYLRAAWWLTTFPGLTNRGGRAGRQSRRPRTGTRPPGVLVGDTLLRVQHLHVTYCRGVPGKSRPCVGGSHDRAARFSHSWGNRDPCEQFQPQPTGAHGDADAAVEFPHTHTLLAFCLRRDQNDSVATIHVREVSDDTLTTLKVRAARSGQSLQAYVRELLEGEAGMLTPEEAAERARTIAARSAVTADDVVGTIAEMREARD